MRPAILSRLLRAAPSSIDGWDENSIWDAVVGLYHISAEMFVLLEINFDALRRRRDYVSLGNTRLPLSTWEWRRVHDTLVFVSHPLTTCHHSRVSLSSFFFGSCETWKTPRVTTISGETNAILKIAFLWLERFTALMHQSWPSATSGLFVRDLDSIICALLRPFTPKSVWVCSYGWIHWPLTRFKEISARNSRFDGLRSKQLCAFVSFFLLLILQSCRNALFAAHKLIGARYQRGY